MKKKYDIVSIFMCIVCFISLVSSIFLITMENRIAPMISISSFDAVGNYTWVMLAILFVILFLSFIKGEDENKNFLTGMITSIFLGVVFYYTGLCAKIFTSQFVDTYRVTWGLGSYFILGAWYSIIIKCNQNIKSNFKKFLTTFTGLFYILMLFIMGAMNSMSISIEYFARADRFYLALQEHFTISILVLISSIAFGLPLGYLCYRYKILNSIMMFFLNIVRSIPSIALILVMVGPLSFLKSIPFFEKLGISSFGFTPVFCALFLYALFQIINSLSGALKTIDNVYLKTAKAMGMTNFSIMWKIQIPLVLPILVSGIRVAIVSTFSAASLGTMVGFGGLGVFITMGGGTAVALDLILLGAVPIIIMIFFVNFIFGLLSEWLDRRMSGKILTSTKY
ncbi:MAG: ABC transporter permease [Lachnospirales bacterium]